MNSLNFKIYFGVINIIEVIFLGTASAIATRSRNHSAIIVKVSNKTMLFDCGEATQKQLIYANISPMKIDEIFITHLHGDHILGLPGLLQSLAFRGRKNPIHIYGPDGIEPLIEHIKEICFSPIDFEIIPHTIEYINDVVYKQEDFMISACKMKHTVPNYAYKLEELRNPKFNKPKALELGIPEGPLFGKLQRGESIELDGKIITPEQVLGPPRSGAKLVYSGDTLPHENMIYFARDVDVLIHEATFAEELRSKAHENGHTVASDAARIAKDANVGKLVLTHLSNRYTDSKPLLDEAREVFENTIYAKDFTKLTIQNDDKHVQVEQLPKQ